jgi:2-polyprenyl-6-methoxyphenol hydroxylase-like FAD-dependent oxidoreductase
VGDAAHATSPNMAQGAAMALEDALVLAACLRDRRSVPEALAAFESRRRPRIDRLGADTHRRDRTRALPPALRGALLRCAGRRIFRAHCRPLLRDAPGAGRPRDSGAAAASL